MDIREAQDAVTLLALFAIPVGVALLLILPRSREAALPRRDGPLGAFVAGIALAAWVSWAGPREPEPLQAVGLAIATVGIVWHLARTVRRLNAAQA